MENRCIRIRSAAPKLNERTEATDERECGQGWEQGEDVNGRMSSFSGDNSQAGGSEPYVPVTGWGSGGVGRVTRSVCDSNEGRLSSGRTTMAASRIAQDVGPLPRGRQALSTERSVGSVQSGYKSVTTKP